MDSGESVIVDIKKYFYLLWMQGKLILLIALAFALVALGLSFLSTPVYRATTTLLIDSRPNNSANNIDSIRASESLARTYGRLITTRGVLNQTIIDAQLLDDYASLRSAVSANPIANTQLLEVWVEDTDPLKAAKIANTIADVFIQQNKDQQSSNYQDSQEKLETQLGYLDKQINETSQALNKEKIASVGAEKPSAAQERLEDMLAKYNQNYATLLQTYEQVRLSQIQATSNIYQYDMAAVPEKPIRPNKLLNTLIAGQLGFLLACGFVLLRDLLDDSVRNPDELSKELNLPVIAQIIHFDTEKHRLISHLQPRAPASEGFRIMRMNIKYAAVDKSLQTLLVTSANPSEGKTTVSANLGIVLAQGGNDVLLIDGDLRRPNLHKAFETTNKQGTSTLFINTLDQLPDVIQKTTVPNLSLMSSGPLPPNPSELYDTQKARLIIGETKRNYDRVVIDAPPLANLTDSIALSQYVDGVIFVIRAGSTSRASVRQAIAQLRRVNANLLGFVITDIDRYAPQTNGYYYSTYEYDQPHEASVNGNGVGLLARKKVKS